MQKSLASQNKAVSWADDPDQMRGPCALETPKATRTRRTSPLELHLLERRGEVKRLILVQMMDEVDPLSSPLLTIQKEWKGNPRVILHHNVRSVFQQIR